MAKERGARGEGGDSDGTRGHCQTAARGLAECCEVSYTPYLFVGNKFSARALLGQAVEARNAPQRLDPILFKAKFPQEAQCSFHSSAQLLRSPLLSQLARLQASRALNTSKPPTSMHSDTLPFRARLSYSIHLYPNDHDDGGKTHGFETGGSFHEVHGSPRCLGGLRG